MASMTFHRFLLPVGPPAVEASGFWAALAHEATRPKRRLQTIDALAWHGESLGLSDSIGFYRIR